MTRCIYDAFYCKIVFCSIIRKKQLSEPRLVLISLDYPHSTVSLNQLLRKLRNNLTNSTSNLSLFPNNQTGLLFVV